MASPFEWDMIGHIAAYDLLLRSLITHIALQDRGPEAFAMGIIHTAMEALGSHVQEPAREPAARALEAIEHGVLSRIAAVRE